MFKFHSNMSNCFALVVVTVMSTKSIWYQPAADFLSLLLCDFPISSLKLCLHEHYKQNTYRLECGPMPCRI